MDNGELKNLLESHFDDDRKAFARIDELMTINGEHFSHFRNDLTKILENQKKEDEHRKRVEPMLLSYEANVAEDKVLGDLGQKWGGRIKKVGGVATALAAIGIVFNWIYTHFNLK